MRKIQLANTKEKISVLGQGTWGISRFFKDKDYYEQWKDSLRKGIQLGMTHIDTAEFYGWGKAEQVVGEVISEYDRDDLFITSKIFPIHFRKKSMKKAADKSLKRLNIEHFDLYLIHWPSFLISIEKQMNVLEDLLQNGKTRYIGVSNFSVEQFKKGQEYLKNTELINNQLSANLTEQEHLYESLPFYQKKNVIMTAYSPLGHKGYNDLEGALRKKLEQVAKNHNATIQQIAIAWLINHKNVITIPKAFHINHLKENARAAEIKLSNDEIKLLHSKPIESAQLITRFEESASSKTISVSPAE
ncbi:MAG: aldo/keto reductase [Candidatus Lokiarchaeota archaeon]|nr:aldo/keto reductase [Candidatus Lokiarchaeota archaeon]MBD3340416.1 aldo/keto reductase [Candidatus Lokiarchaeota archaeon]